MCCCWSISIPAADELMVLICTKMARGCRCHDFHQSVIKAQRHQGAPVGIYISKTSMKHCISFSTISTHPLPLTLECQCIIFLVNCNNILGYYFSQIILN